MSSTRISMNPAVLDERQVAARDRGGSLTYVVLLALVLLNGAVVDRLGMWASGLTQALTLFFVSASFYVVHAVRAGAQWRSSRQGRSIAALFLLVLLADAGLIAWHAARRPGLDVWHDHRAGGDFLVVVQTCFFLATSVAMALQLRRDRRGLSDQD